MVEIIYGEYWDIECDWRGFTSNLEVTKSGHAVMGRGTAKLVADRYPEIKIYLGIALQRPTRSGFYPLSSYTGTDLKSPYHIFAFPVKYGWRQPANIKLIQESTNSLTRLAKIGGGLRFLLPIPGVGNGRLKIKQVWPIIKHLPNNVILITNRKEEYMKILTLSQLP